ncbi:protein-glucosylgalactosylhydroxylysine glucosidase-like [Ptychodera flava]|uniref:protein-glucosylgalactosylhydroxylysine glucosidase-like n=1 Tax=Ptychodera flava TaxID=63121 RepID=UPI00396A797F
MHGRILTAESATSGHPEFHLYTNQIPSELTLQGTVQSQTWTSVTSLSLNKSQAVELFEIGRDLAEKGTGLKNSHVEAWENKWNHGCIHVDGNLTLSKAVHASMYYILSSLPPLTVKPADFIFYGLSPGSLATGGKTHDDDYNGHVFWDMETWMYPAMLIFHPSLAKMMLMYRVRNLEAAKSKARSHGYKGAMFPWESAYSGIEVCPGAPYADYEQHITGDIALAVWQYLSVTRDVDFLNQDGGWQLITSIAEFWESRVELDQVTGKYVIKGVMPPDEYHRCVDNSVYTNVVAKISLQLPYFAAKLIGRADDVTSHWSTIADNLHIPFDDVNRYHPEFDGYTLGTEVKQADVILLGFPLNYDMPADVRRNDLVNYDKVTDQWGPAMTWSMFAIGWLELAEYKKANDVFQRCFANIQEPFKTWTEVADGSGAYNFITGMGGFLQTIIFGYGGIRIHSDYLELNPVLPIGTDKLTFTGINYLEASFTVVVKETMVTITMDTKAETAEVFELVHKDEVKVFVKGEPIQAERCKLQIRNKGIG